MIILKIISNRYQYKNIYLVHGWRVTAFVRYSPPKFELTDKTFTIHASSTKHINKNGLIVISESDSIFKYYQS